MRRPHGDANWERTGGRTATTMRLTLADELITQVATATSDEALNAALFLATERMGFNHFALSYDRRPGLSGTHRFLLHNYPDAWARPYVRLDLHASDPVRRVCEKSPHGFGWKEMNRFIALSKSDDDFMDIAFDNGLADGYTVPRHLPGEGGGSCTFAISPDTPFPDDMRYVAELVGSFAVFNALKRFEPVRLSDKRPLTERQLECLLWSARGKTNAEIAIILDISVQTVAQHLRVARERADVHCRQQLILCSLFEGLISFADIFDWWNKH